MCKYNNTSVVVVDIRFWKSKMGCFYNMGNLLSRVEKGGSNTIGEKKDRDTLMDEIHGVHSP